MELYKGSPLPATPQSLFTTLFCFERDAWHDDTTKTLNDGMCYHGFVAGWSGLRAAGSRRGLGTGYDREGPFFFVSVAA